MTINTSPLTDEALLEAIAETGMQAGPTGIFTTSDQKIISAAQKVVIDNNYTLSDAQMIERHMYVLYFLSPDSSYPYHVYLRYVSNGLQPVPLALMYHGEDGTLQQFGTPGSTRTTYGVGTSDGEKILHKFRQQRFNDKYYWVPVFENSCLVQV